VTGHHHHLGHRHVHSHDPSHVARSRQGLRVLWVSVVVLTVVGVLQLVVVVVSGSAALAADTVHNFSDALTAVPLGIAFALGAAARGPRRAEDLAGLFVVVMIAASAVVVGWHAVRELSDPAMTNLPVVAAAGVIGFVGNEVVAQYRIRVGRQIASAALVADGHHARADGLTSLAVVVAAGASWAGYPQADPVIGLVVALVIAVIAVGAGRLVWRRLRTGQPAPGIGDTTEGI